MHSFPDDFLFGCSTSAHQVEGGLNNDWTEWEDAGRLLDPGVRSGRATDHWNRWEEDFELLSELGLGAYRFSIEWSRVEPEPGRFDAAAIEQYVAMTDRLLSLGIEPVITFLHFTHPSWFHASCPWHEERGAPDRFAAFVRRVMQRLEERCRFFTVLNEPMVWLLGGYLTGLIPPGHKRLVALTRAAAQLVRGYVRARSVIKAYAPNARCGIAHNVVHFAPDRTTSVGDRWMTHGAHQFYNHAFPAVLTRGELSLDMAPRLGSKIRIPEAEGTLDFLGLNYYTRAYIRWDPLRRRGPHRVWSFFDDRGDLGVSDLGWGIHPRSLKTMLEDMARYDVPLIITENGLDDADDSRRARFIYDHLQAVLDARRRGVDVRGYLHWSLLDNFEWLEGYRPRFGLVEVDYETMRRSVRPSARYYADIALARALPLEAPALRAKAGEPKAVAPPTSWSADSV